MIARAALAAACLLAAGCLATRAEAAPAFDGARALRDLAELVRASPHARAALLAERLRQAGFAARHEAPEPGLANVIGERRGASEGLVLVVTHYDARPGTGPAANEGFSGPALLLELARSLQAVPLERTLWLVFFDGHESGLRGSRALAARMEREGALARVRALVLVERVGDADLRLEASTLTPPRLRALALRAAASLEPPALLDPLARPHFDSDHLPFVRKGVRDVLALADLRFGPGDPPGRWTHTPADDLGRVSAHSLARVGALAASVVRELVRDPTGTD